MIAFQDLGVHFTCDATWRRNGVAILSRSWDINTSGLAAVIFKSRLPVTSGSIRSRAIELLDLENGGLAVGTESLSVLEAEI